MDVETYLCEKSNIDEVDMTDTITSSWLINVISNKTINKYARNLLEDFINLIFIF